MLASSQDDIYPSSQGAEERKGGDDDVIHECPRDICPFLGCGYCPTPFSQMLNHFRHVHPGAEVPVSYRVQYMEQCPDCLEWLFSIGRHRPSCRSRSSQSSSVRRRAPRTVTSQSSLTPITSDEISILPAPPATAPTSLADRSSRPFVDTHPQSQGAARSTTSLVSLNEGMLFLDELDLEHFLGLNVPTMRDIPAKAAVLFARCLKLALDEPFSVDRNAKLFLLMPRWLLSFDRDDTGNTRQRKVVRRCESFLQRRWFELHEEALSAVPSVPQPSSQSDIQDDSLLKAVSNLVHGGYLSLAAARLNSNGVLATTELASTRGE